MGEKRATEGATAGAPDAAIPTRDGGPAPTRPAGLRWRSVTVAGQPAAYGVAGDDGPTVVFLHGWGLAHRSYRAPLARLAATGARVIAPALPGFGGTPDLTRTQFSLSGYAAWVERFLEAIDIAGPVTVVGHSFGGGVAIRLAHDVAGRVDRLVLINSIGGSAWTGTRGMLRAITDRPLSDWGPHQPVHTWPVRQLTRVLPVVIEDAVPNLLRNPSALWRVAGLARAADLTAELTTLRQRRVPATVVWSHHDTLLPRACLLAIRAALGQPEIIDVPGNHNWLLNNPECFAELVSQIVGASPRQLRSGDPGPHLPEARPA